MYLTLKTIHIISMVAWFAGMFYIWRLFVYHVESDKTEVHKQLEIMEEKLFRIIMQPAFFLTIITGISLLYLSWNIFSTQYWIWLKIMFVIFLSIHHYLSNYYRKLLLKNTQAFQSRFFRLMNEVPTLFLIVIVTLVVFKFF